MIISTFSTSDIINSTSVALTFYTINYIDILYKRNKTAPCLAIDDFISYLVYGNGTFKVTCIVYGLQIFLHQICTLVYGNTLQKETAGEVLGIYANQ